MMKDAEWNYRVKNEGDSTYSRPSRDSADRTACECLKHYGRGCHGVIETKTESGWEIVARFAYGHGITDVSVLPSTHH